MSFLTQFLDVHVSTLDGGDTLYLVERTTSNREIENITFIAPFLLKNAALKDREKSTIKFEYKTLQKFTPKYPDTSKELETLLDHAIGLVETIRIVHQNNLLMGPLLADRFYIDDKNDLKLLGNSLISKRYVHYTFDQYNTECFHFLPPECYENNNLIPDKHADFYSLGIILYRWFTGRLPFKGKDKLELMHQHLTSSIIPPKKQNQNISKNLNNLILNLLKKQAGERYASSYGILKDLNTIKDAYLKNEKSNIVLSTDYNPGSINFGTTLFGRDEQFKELTDYYNRIDLANSQAIFVDGFSGVGKTSLVNRFLNTVTDKQTIILSGKFDQYSQTPYAVIKAAFENFEKQILLKSRIAISTLKLTIAAKLGKNAAVLHEIIPSLAVLTDTMEPVEVLNPIETRNRFNFVFQKLSQIFQSLGLKLILFIDDWQWCDQPSLQLIKFLVQQNTRGILFLFAYRGNEVDANHPFRLFKNEVEKTAYFHHLPLNSLNIESTNKMLAMALELDEHKTKPLARLIHQKTEGNPFYIKQFITVLNEKGLLRFQGDAPDWNWDEEAIKKEGLSANVIDLISEKIDQLSYEGQIIFKIASCIGGKFDMKLISEISGLSEVLISVLLDVSMNSGYIEKTIKEKSTTYKFVHDKIQQAAYQLVIPAFPFSNEELHLKIGSKLFDNQEFEDYSENEVLSHFLSARDLISEDLATKIIDATVALSTNTNISINPEASKQYFELGQFLNAKYKTNRAEYQLLYSLSESSFLLNQVEEAEVFSEMAINATDDTIKKTKVLRMKMLFYESYAMYEQNIETGLQALALFDIDVQDSYKNKSLETSIEDEYVLFNELSRDGTYVKDLSIRKMDDEKELAIMDILVNMNASAYFADLHLFAWSTIKMSNQTLQYGFTNSTPFAFVFMGCLLVALYQDFERGYIFGKSGVDLLNKVTSDQYKCRTLSIFPIFIQHFKEPIRDSIENLDESIYSGLETGDLPYAGYSFYAKVRDAFLAGDDLQEILRLCEDSISFMEGVNNLGLLALMKLLKGSLLKLAGAYTQDYELVEKEALEFLINVKFYTAVSHHYIFRSWVCCILKEFTKASELLTLNKEIIIYAASQPHVPKHYFLESICILYENKRLSKSQLEQIESNQKVLRAWGNSMPENFNADYYLIETLLTGRSGNIEKALTSFNETLKWATKGELLGTKAFAFEVASDMLVTSDFLVLGESFFDSAQNAYSRWGAVAKLHKRKIGRSESEKEDLIATTDLNTSSLVKAMQAISSEVNKDKAIGKLLKVLMEHAGADRSILVLIEQSIPYVEAESVLGNLEKSLERIPYQKYKLLPKGIIDYVLNTQQEFVLDSQTDIEHLNETYIHKSGIKSLLALPLIRQQELIGVLYLENKEFEGLFKGNDLEILKIIASQAAISIYNTLLFKETTDLNIDLRASKDELSKMNLLLEDKIKDRTKVLRQEIETRKQIELELKKAQKKAEKFHQQQIKEERKEVLQSKMMMLSSQMNPHFIFNSLGSVQSYILNNETNRAVDFISEFAGLMRKNLINSTTRYISIAEEIEFLDKYLLLEKIRFNKNFDYTIDDQIDNIHDTLIPPMLLQPFIENAVIHGLSKLQEKRGKLIISLKEDDENIVCTIIDNGIGRENALKHKSSSHKSVAISNLETRLELLNHSSETKEY
ncbi:MAG: AAA family ATPase, partial [Flavobacteriaceae bacterium]|nr:AAA family ATPase [Flavobacteriaceae bacterium]